MLMISPQVTVRLLRTLAEPKHPKPEQLVVGAELFVSPGTVKNHLAAVQRKLGVRNRVGVAAGVIESL